MLQDFQNQHLDQEVKSFQPTFESFSPRSWTPPSRSGRGVGGGTESRRIGGRAEPRTRAQSRGAPRLHRCLSGDGIRLHVAGGPDRQLAHAQRRRSVWPKSSRPARSFRYDEIVSLFSIIFFCTDPEAARAASSKITTTLGLVVHAAGD